MKDRRRRKKQSSKLMFISNGLKPQTHVVNIINLSPLERAHALLSNRLKLIGCVFSEIFSDGGGSLSTKPFLSSFMSMKRPRTKFQE